MSPEECARHLEETSAMPRDEAGGVIPCEECVEAVAHLRRLAALEVLIGAGRQEVMALVAENARLREALKNITGAIETSPWIDAYQLAGGRYEGLQAIAHLALRREALGEGVDPAREALERTDAWHLERRREALGEGGGGDA